MTAPLTAEDVWKLFAETDRRFQETALRFQESDRQFQETERLLKQQSQATERKLKEQGKRLVKKFGSFTEGLAMPSLEKMLRERFGMTVFSPRVKVRQGEEEIEIDLLSYANGAINSVYLVEIKSHLDERAIAQTLELLERFPRLFPEHKEKALYGILACVHGSKELRRKVLEAGLFLAAIHDEQFRLEVPKGFAPKRFDVAGAGFNSVQ